PRACARRRHRLEQRERTPADHLRSELPPQADERAGRGHVRACRDSGARGSRTRHRVTMDLRAVVVDDEQLARDELGYLLGGLGGVEIIGQAGNGVEALGTIARLQPDVVFLDVQMPGLTGFEVARRLLETRASAEIIFVTAYDQHAIEAFEVNAVDYLLKPVE